METYNDDLCQCPICFETYSLVHRPTTFLCGHSDCIEHVCSNNGLNECPVCGYSLKISSECHVSYSLEEVVRVFNALKNSIYGDILIKKEEKVEKTGAKSRENVYAKDLYDEELQKKGHFLDQIHSSSDRRSTRSELFSH